MKIKLLTLALVAFAAFTVVQTTSPARADERIAPAAQLLAEGYTPVQKHEFSPLSVFLEPLPYAEHSLPWPIQYGNDAPRIGNGVAQFQPYIKPGYWHGGCDMLVNTSRHLLVTPIAGKLEAGHYSYAAAQGGRLTKFWKPWPMQGDPSYFEIAIVSDEGYRFELHHVDRARLPSSIIDLLNKGGGRVEAGTPVGYAVDIFGSYNHTHYNVISPSGIAANPQYVSPPLGDTRAPTLHGAYALDSGASFATRISDGFVFSKHPKEIVLQVTDAYSTSDRYDHPPLLVRVLSGNTSQTVYDFRQMLVTESGEWPILYDTYAKSILTNTGERLETSGGYGVGHSLVRVPIDSTLHGEFQIEISDGAGNKTVLNGTLP